MEKLLTPLELANYIGIALQTIYNRRANGSTLPKSITIGRQIRFRETDVDHWLSTQYEKEKGDLCTSTRELCNPKKGRPTKAEQIAKRSSMNGLLGVAHVRSVSG